MTEMEFAQNDKRDYVAVPKALLELCLGLIESIPVVPQNFPDDLLLARAQLRVAIAE